MSVAVEEPCVVIVLCVCSCGRAVCCDCVLFHIVLTAPIVASYINGVKWLIHTYCAIIMGMVSIIAISLINSVYRFVLVQSTRGYLAWMMIFIDFKAPWQLPIKYLCLCDKEFLVFISLLFYRGIFQTMCWFVLGHG